MSIIFTTPGYSHLSENCNLNGNSYFPNRTHEIAVTYFPDGEFEFRIPDDRIEDEHVRLLGGCHDAHSTELLLASAYEIALLKPASLTVVVTYMRSARSERSNDGSAVLAKFQANLWSGLGNVFPGVRIQFIDLHSDLILNYFHGPVHVSNIVQDVRESLFSRLESILGEDESLCFATVDDGRSSSLRKFAAQNDATFAHIVKQRLSGSVTKVLEVQGDVEGKTVVIWDDMIATAGSLCNAAKAYKERGATRILACASHGVFCGDALNNIGKSDIDRIFVTDSHQNALKASAEDARVVVVPLSGVFF